MEKRTNTNEAKRIKEFRLAEGMTLGEMGELLDRSVSHVQKFEDGTRRIQIKDVKTLHTKKGMSYEWFYHGKGHRLYKPEKSSLVKDIAAITSTVSILESKLEQLDAGLNKIYRDFYTD